MSDNDHCLLTYNTLLQSIPSLSLRKKNAILTFQILSTYQADLSCHKQTNTANLRIISSLSHPHTLEVRQADPKIIYSTVKSHALEVIGI